jgi:trehalose 6-phosphate synthase
MSPATPDAPSPSAPLTLLANRAPIRQTDGGWEPGLGGLATALLPVVEGRGGAWVSMRGPDEDAPLDQPFPADQPRFTVRRVPLDEEAFDLFYRGMANGVLWPLAHYALEHVEPDRDYLDAYRETNRRFAEAALDAQTDPAGAFWIHDYHLMLAPALVRRERPDAAIGFFWHIPWPAVDVLRVLPSARELVRGMLGSGLIGFHTEGYARHFREAARDLLGAEVRGDCVHWDGREVRVEAHPIGIDVAKFEGFAATDEVKQAAYKLHDAIRGEHLILGIDRLDYTKGLLLRLEAFERFLQRHPEYHRRVTLYQIATPSRTGIEAYQQLKREVDEAVGRINGAFARGGWLPIRYRYRAYTQEELVVRYAAADVALVTPLRDGMNLVAQEAVAASERVALVLSDLTGAAHFLDGAVLVNPYDQDGLADALLQALEMSEEERRDRLRRMQATVRAMDVHRWAERFLVALDRTAPVPTSGGDPRPALV